MLVRIRVPADQLLQKLDGVLCGWDFAVHRVLYAAGHFHDVPALPDLEAKINLGVLGYRREPLLGRGRGRVLA